MRRKRVRQPSEASPHVCVPLVICAGGQEEESLAEAGISHMLDLTSLVLHRPPHF